MKNRYYGPVTKAVAFVMFFVTLALCAACGVGTVYCGDKGLYTKAYADIRNRELYWIAYDDCHEIADFWAQQKYGAENMPENVYFYDGDVHAVPQEYNGYSNLRYQILDQKGKLLYGNYDGQETIYQAEKTVTPHYAVWVHKTTQAYDPESDLYFPEESSYYDYKELSFPVTVKTYILKNMEVRDRYYWSLMLIENLYRFRYAVIAGAVVFGLLTILLFVFQLCAAGHRKGLDGIYLNFLDRIPLDLILLADIIWLAIISEVWYFNMVEALAIAASGAVLAMLNLLTLAARLKHGNGYWYRQTLTFWVLHWIWNLRKPLLRGYYLLPLAWRWLAVGVGISLLALLAFAAESAFLLCLAILAGVVSFVYVAFSLARLQREIDRFAKGDLRESVELKYLYGSFRRMGEDIGALGETANRAVEQRMKSERMKTELITNVSHDIKTPLTSIVTYVDLLKNAEADAQREEYLEVLDRQAQKLKKLTVDLIDVSKAASGAMPVDLQKTNIVELVNQAVAEYSAKMEQARLNVVMKTPEVEPVTLADGRLLWRVLDNLLGNCVKYAQSGTRVYVNVGADEQNVSITIKNVSREELDLPAEELMERFVRGDRARNTEGSGLGLNIAQNLMELQGGALELEVDGDLFKVTAKLPVMKND